MVPVILDNLTDDELKKEAKNESKNDAISAIIKAAKCLVSRVPNQEEMVKSLEIFRLKMILRYENYIVIFIPLFHSLWEHDKMFMCVHGIVFCWLPLNIGEAFPKFPTKDNCNIVHTSPPPSNMRTLLAAQTQY